MTIKETSGKILLYFYQLQRTVPASMAYRQLGFIDKPDGSVYTSSDKKWLTKDLQDINPSATDIFNAFNFLIDKGFIRSQERIGAGKRIYVGIHLTGLGIDIVEGIERGSDGRGDFHKMFNISVSSNTTVEELITQTLSKLLDKA